MNVPLRCSLVVFIITVALLPSCLPGALDAQTISIFAADLQDNFGNPMPTSAVAVLVADTGTNGFTDLQPTFPLHLGATWGAENKVVGLWNLSNCGCGDGILMDQTVVSYTGGVTSNQLVQLYWFPSLTMASNTLGITYYGKYRDTNSPPLDGSDVWKTPRHGSTTNLVFLTANEGGSNPQTAGEATLATGLIASFSGAPTSGTAPLFVTFADTSTGSITNRFWDFGDTTTTNITTNSVIHTYAAGTYNVTLVVSGSGGSSTNTQPNYITALTAFQSWQMQYFGCTNCAQAQPNADPYGKGMSNTNQFLAGFDPTDSTTYLHVISIARTNSTDVDVVYLGADGDSTWSPGIVSRTNVLEFTAGTASGGYSNNFASTGQTNILSGGTGLGAVTNMVDPGGATNSPSRYYRVRVLLP